MEQKSAHLVTQKKKDEKKAREWKSKTAHLVGRMAGGGRAEDFDGRAGRRNDCGRNDCGWNGWNGCGRNGQRRQVEVGPGLGQGGQHAALLRLGQAAHKVGEGVRPAPRQHQAQLQFRVLIFLRQERDHEKRGHGTWVLRLVHHKALQLC